MCPAPSSAVPTVVVTGASAGVGRAVVEAYAARGARIALLARGRAGLEGAAAAAKRLGADAVLTIAVDVADADGIEAAAQRTEDELGPIDVWVNCAMTSVFAPVMETTPKEYRRVMDVIFLGYVHGTQAALRRMLPRNRGSIVQVGSALAYRGIPAQSAYCSAKHAVQGFDDSLRAELRGLGTKVRLSAVQMPALNTPQFGWVRTRLPNHPQPVPPIYQPEVAARAVLWAADHGPRDINVGVSTLLTRLGNKFAPGVLDRYLGRTGLESQQTDQPVDHKQWRDNLFDPVDDEKDYGAHGIFDDRSISRSPALWAVTHKPALAAAGAVAAAAVGAASAALAARR
jgi:NAD(P)-dependent dehydrogenase (short-subunit alcohol dehydrogenase family)